MKKLTLFFSILFVLFSVAMAFIVKRYAFDHLSITFASLFLLYFALCFIKTSISVKAGLVLAAVSRLVFVPAFPELSDDIYRFFWDGLLSIHGSHPFAFTPIQLFEMGLPAYLQEDLFNSLNSKTYYTVYPPLSQLIFALTTYLSGNSLATFTILLKIWIILAEVGVVYFLLKLLNQFQLPSRNILLYALNPLVIIEGVGNLHFEIFMILFVILGLYFGTQKKWFWMTLCIALSISLKLVSAILWPFLFSWMGFKKWIKYSFVLTGITLLLFFPLWQSDYLQHFTTSLNLYFQTFEFNASIYYVLRAIGQLITGYNLIAWIGPILSLLSAVIVFHLIRRTQNKPLEAGLSLFILGFTVYLLCSTTVHPWYILLPVAVAPVTGMRYILLWSGLIWLSYSAYGISKVEESTLFLLLEYSGLLIALYLDRREIIASFSKNLPSSTLA